MKRNLGYADNLGYGYCHDCRAEKVNYTPEPEERCALCGRTIVDVPDGEAVSDIIEATPCRIF